MFEATHKQTGQVIRGIPGIPKAAEEHLLGTSYWCAARQVAALVTYLVGCPNACSAEGADYVVKREDG